MSTDRELEVQILRNNPDLEKELLRIANEGLKKAQEIAAQSVDTGAYRDGLVAGVENVDGIHIGYVASKDFKTWILEKSGPGRRGGLHTLTRSLDSLKHE